MASAELISLLQADFQFLLKDKDVLGAFLYGSQAEGEATPRSDFDVCVVTRRKDKPSLKALLRHIWQQIPVSTKKYDVHMFHELPLYIQGHIIEKGVLLLSRDTPELFEYLYPYRRLWEDQKHRNELSDEELNEILNQKKT